MNRMYTVNDQNEIRFFQVPKRLYDNPLYKEVTNGAKMMYAILRDRQDLSIANQWVDEQGFIFFYFDVDKLSDYMNVTRPTITKYKKELVKHGLLFQKRQGQGKPNKMYILKAESVAVTLKENNLTSRSKEILQLEVKKLYTNDTELSDTESNDTENLHHLGDDVCVFLNLLEEHSLNAFGKSIRKHNGNYDLEILQDMTKDEMIEFIEDHITRYDYCNLDYVQLIQARAM